MSMMVGLSRLSSIALAGILMAAVAVSCATKPVVPQPPAPAPAAKAPRPPAGSAAPAHPGAVPSYSGYYTCGMHPDVRSLDPDGKCPRCEMPLLPAEQVQVVDPDTGKTNTAATFPIVSGWYTCAMHPTVLVHDRDAKCPVCQMPLLPVESDNLKQDQ